ncbi:MAG TPA: cation diffusion facilitator family transporter [bacterium]|nr:cation diffusion facilitator family transporter [bacterium]
MTATTAHAHGHGHGTLGPGRPGAALSGALAVIFALMVIEAVGGWWTGSLALLADAGHLLVDVGSLGMGLLAAWIASRPATAEMSYGYRRAEILAAATNGVALWAIALAIGYEAVARLRAPHPIAASGMLGVAALGLGGNLAASALLVRGHGENLNLRAALAHVLADAAAASGTIAAGLVILVTGWTPADAIVGLGVAVLLVAGAWPLLREAVRVLMEGTPPGIALLEVHRAIAAAPGVCGVHDLHIWSLTSGVGAVSAHVLVDEGADTQEVLTRLGTLLRDRFGLSHVTLQVETSEFLEPWHPRCAPGADPHGAG